MGKGSKKKTIWRTFSFGEGVDQITPDSYATIDTDNTSRDSQGLNNNVYDSTNGSNFKSSSRRNRFQNSHNGNKPTSDYVKVFKNNFYFPSLSRNNNDNNTNNNNGNTDENISNNTNNNNHNVYQRHHSSYGRYEKIVASRDRSNGNCYQIEDGMTDSQCTDTYFKKRSFYQKHNRSYRYNGVSGTSGGLLHHYKPNNRNYHSSNPHNGRSDNSSSKDNHNNNGSYNYNNHDTIKIEKISSNNSCSSEKSNTNDSNITSNFQNGTNSLATTKHNFNEDEYTRITTPRSEVLFKKGYLTRPKKYDTQTSTTNTSSNGSATVSVTSTDDSASYYQSISPEANAYMPQSYLPEGYEQDLSLLYPPGFYGQSGYFYVNPFVSNGFDQYNGPAIMMPYGNPQFIQNVRKDMQFESESVYSTLSSTPPMPEDAKDGSSETSTGKFYDKRHSVNSDESSSSVISETEHGESPLFSPEPPVNSEQHGIETNPSADDLKTTIIVEEVDIKETVACPNVTEIDEIENENIEQEIGAQQPEEETTLKDEEETEINDKTNAEIPTGNNFDEITTQENCSTPFYPPFIFGVMPQLPFMALEEAPDSSNRFNTYIPRYNPHYGSWHKPGRYRKHRRGYCQSNYTMNSDNIAATNGMGEDRESNETASSEKISIDECDNILNTTNLNTNVSEFIPRNQKTVFVPIPVPPPPLPTSSTLLATLQPPTVKFHNPSNISESQPTIIESTLNADVPEFRPRHYVPTVPNEQNQLSIEQTITADKQQINEQIICNEKIASTDSPIRVATKYCSLNENGCEQNCEHDENDLNNNGSIGANSIDESINKNNDIDLNNNFDIANDNNDKNNNNNISISMETHTYINSKADLVNKRFIHKIKSNDAISSSNINRNQSKKNSSSNNKNKFKNSIEHTAINRRRRSWTNNDQNEVKSHSKSKEMNDKAKLHQIEASSKKDSSQAKSDHNSAKLPSVTYAQMAAPPMLKTIKAAPEICTKRGSDTNITEKTIQLKSEVRIVTEKPNKTYSSKVSTEDELSSWHTVCRKNKRKITIELNEPMDVENDSDPNEDVDEAAINNSFKLLEDRQASVTKPIENTINEEISKPPQTETPALAKANPSDVKEKAVNKTKKKNSSKKKSKRPTHTTNKNLDTFDIIEPTFTNYSTDSTSQSDETLVSSVIEGLDNFDINDPAFDEIYPKVVSPIFAHSPSTLMQQLLFTSKPNKIDLANKTWPLIDRRPGTFHNNNALNLVDQFDIYEKMVNGRDQNQNILLKEEEEMVIRVLKELNGTDDEKLVQNSDETTQKQIEKNTHNMKMDFLDVSNAWDPGERSNQTIKQIEQLNDDIGQVGNCDEVNDNFLTEETRAAVDLEQTVTRTDKSTDDETLGDNGDEVLDDTVLTDIERKGSVADINQLSIADIDQISADTKSCKESSSDEESNIENESSNSDKEEFIVEIDENLNKLQCDIVFDLNEQNNVTPSTVQNDSTCKSSMTNILSNGLISNDETFLENAINLKIDSSHQRDEEHTDHMQLLKELEQLAEIRRSKSEKTWSVEFHPELAPKTQTTIENKFSDVLVSGIQVNSKNSHIDSMQLKENGFEHDAEYIQKSELANEKGSGMNATNELNKDNSFQILERFDSGVQVDANDDGLDTTTSSTPELQFNESCGESNARTGNRLHKDSGVMLTDLSDSEQSQPKPPNKAKSRVIRSKMMEQETKQMMQAFPITQAVTRWLDQAKKENTPEPILRLPTNIENNFFLNNLSSDAFLQELNKLTPVVDGRYSSSSSSDINVNDSVGKNEVNSSKDAVSQSKNFLFLDLSDYEDINLARIDNDDDNDDDIDDDDDDNFDDDDDDEEIDIINFLDNNSIKTESSSKSPVPPVYTSVYGKSINYENLLANQNEFLSNNIINYGSDSLMKPISKKKNNTVTAINMNDNTLDGVRIHESNSQTMNNSSNTGTSNKKPFKSTEMCCRLM